MNDSMVKIIGYQVNFGELKEGFFLFNHMVPHCQTTLAIAAGLFFDLYSGPIFQGRRTKAEGCLGYCLHRDNLKHCPECCECAFVRDILQTVNEWPKRKAG